MQAKRMPPDMYIANACIYTFDTYRRPHSCPLSPKNGWQCSTFEPDWTNPGFDRNCYASCKMPQFSVREYNGGNWFQFWLRR
jgi:hypothetical protein